LIDNWFSLASTSFSVASSHRRNCSALQKRRLSQFLHNLQPQASKNPSLYPLSVPAANLRPKLVVSEVEPSPLPQKGKRSKKADQGKNGKRLALS